MTTMKEHCQQKVTKLWMEPHRYYHDLNHLSFLYEEIDRSSWSSREKMILEVAAAYHDVIYYPWRIDNEEQSEKFFRDNWNPLVFTKAEKDQVSKIILDTKIPYTTQILNPLSNYFREIDYNYAFSMNPLKYEISIAKEYSFAPYDIYYQNRMNFLFSICGVIPMADKVIDIVQGREINLGIYAGTFNPFHIGHLDILHKAMKIFDKVIIAQGINPEKQSVKAEGPDMASMIPYVQQVSFPGLLTDYIKELNCQKKTNGGKLYSNISIIRGTRNSTDYAYEINNLRYMKDLDPEVQVVFIPCEPSLEHISSSSIKGLSKFDPQFISKYTPPVYEVNLNT